jgi:Holliday junction resolvase-like predicted endonuclease
MTQKSEIGKLGEDLACEHLIKRGYKIIERNFRKPWGELDIIVKQNNGTLVFVEVKTIKQTEEFRGVYNLAEYAPNSLWQAIRQYGNTAMLRKMRQKIGWKESLQIMPEENLTAAKLKKLQRTAQLYVGHNQELVDDKMGWRIDLIAITLCGDSADIKYFENL